MYILSSEHFDGEENHSHCEYLSGLYACAMQGVSGNVGACNNPAVFVGSFGTVPKVNIGDGIEPHPLLDPAHGF